jgi:hypothetical protein
VVADIVDPHGAQFADAVFKMHGLAKYVEAHPEAFRRVEVLTEISGRMRVLDLTRADVRKAVMQAKNAESLYRSAIAGDYP